MNAQIQAITVRKIRTLLNYLSGARFFKANGRNNRTNLRTLSRLHPYVKRRRYYHRFSLCTRQPFSRIDT